LYFVIKVRYITDNRLELAAKGSCSVDNACILDFSAEKAAPRPDVAEVQNDYFSNGTVTSAEKEQ